MADLLSQFDEEDTVVSQPTSRPVTQSAPSGGDLLSQFDTPASSADPLAQFDTGDEAVTVEDMISHAAKMGFGDTYRGVKQIFGLNEEEMKRDQQLLEKYLADEEHGGKVLAAYTAGLFGDPVGWLIPGMKAKNIASATKAGLVFGSISGATGYVPEDMTRLESTLWGTAGGGVLSPAMFKFNNTVAPTIAKAYGNEVVPRIEKVANKYIVDPVSGLADRKFLGLHKLGEWFIEDYGLPKAFVDLRKKMGITKNEYISRFTNVLKKYETIADDPAADALLYKILNGDESKIPADLSTLTKESRKVVDDFGKELVDLGLLDKATWRENRGKYLHRTYLKHETSKKISRNPRDIKVFGGELMRRGKNEEVPASELDGYIADGWKQISDIGKNKKVWVNRDWTEAERKKMGEITSASYAMAKTAQMMTNDAATFKFYDDIAKNPELTWTPINKREASFGAPPGYSKVPTDEITKGINRYGNLAGKYVPDEVLQALKSQQRFQKVFRTSVLGNLNHKMNQWWKRTKTTLNPTVHMNNTIAGAGHYDMADGDWSLIKPAVKSLITKDKDYELAQKYAVFDADLLANELTRDVETYLKKYMSKGLGNVDDVDFFTKAWEQTKLRIGGYAKETHMDKLYRAEDNAYRLALFKTRLNKGDSPETAALYARKWMVDYEVHTPGVKALRETMLPFITYTYRSAPLLFETAYKKPWKMAKWGAILASANFIGEDIAPGDNAYERKLIEENARSNRLYMNYPLGAFGIEQYTQLKVPRADRSQYLDVTRFFPAADVLEGSESGIDIPGLPTPLQPSFGSIGGIGKAVTGFDTYTGKMVPGVGSDEPYYEAMGRLNVLAKEFMPTWLPGGHTWEKLSNADSEYHATKDNYSLAEAVMNSFGIKVKTFEEEKQVQRGGYKYKARVDSLRSLLTRLTRDYEADRISEKEYIEESDKILDRIDKIAGELDEAISY